LTGGIPASRSSSIGFLGVLLLGPVLFVWGLWHWRRRRARAAGDE
jgi:hypothetical protein